jgi:hypothetical protein
VTDSFEAMAAIVLAAGILVDGVSSDALENARRTAARGGYRRVLVEAGDLVELVDAIDAFAAERKP